MQAIAECIAYPDFLGPLREAARRYLKYPSTVGKDGVANIGHRPWVARANYMLMLYPGLDAGSLERYSQRFGIEVPRSYAAVLREVNGAFCFGMSLAGVPPSMLGDPPLLDRTVLPCHDLATAATLWARQYRVPAGLFHFGSRHFSASENVGYFLGEGERILSVKKTGEVVGEWAGFPAFLADELRASEQLEEALHPSRWEG